MDALTLDTAARYQRQSELGYRVARQALDHILAGRSPAGTTTWLQLWTDASAEASRDSRIARRHMLVEMVEPLPGEG